MKKIIIGILLIIGANVNAQTYNPKNAVAYAKEWCNKRNTDQYNDYSGQGGDCANFVSQCLKAGGLDLSAGNPTADPLIFVDNGVDNKACLVLK